MRDQLFALVVLVPSVVVLVSMLLGAIAAGGPCPSASGGGC
jgi:hypothetical protein